MLQPRTFGRLAIAVRIATAPLALAASSDLDPTFGVGGKVSALGTDLTHARALAVQADGKLVVAGHGPSNWFAVARYDANGTGDPTFDGDGKVLTPFDGAIAYAESLAIQADGRIVAAGGTTVGGDYDFALVRYEADGDLDPDFGDGGKVVTPIGAASDFLWDVVLQPDGKIVAVGDAEDAFDELDFAVVRYDEEGTIDTSFGGGTGKVTTPIGPHLDRALSVALQVDGKIVVGGYSFGFAGSGFSADFAVVRYEADGTLDTTFGGTGKVTTPIGVADDYGSAVAIQADGKIVLAGTTSQGSSNLGDFAVVRYGTDGSLDASFGLGGIVVTPLRLDSPNLDGAYAIAVQPDGRIVVAGATSYDTGRPALVGDFALVRYLPDGTLDTTFGGTGKIVTPFGADADDALAVAIQADGKIVAAGRTSDDPPYLHEQGFAIARYEPEASCPLTRVTTCIETWSAASLLVRDAPEKTRKVVARLVGGPAFSALDFGNPLAPGGTSYSVCIYDDADRLAGKLEVDRAGADCGADECWSALGPLGFRYKDARNATDGVRGITLLATPSAQRSKILVNANSRSSKEIIDMPVGIASALQGTSSATLQILGSDAPECFSATLGRVQRSTAVHFQAKQ